MRGPPQNERTTPNERNHPTQQRTFVLFAGQKHPLVVFRTLTINVKPITPYYRYSNRSLPAISVTANRLSPFDYAHTPQTRQLPAYAPPRSLTSSGEKRSYLK